MSRVAIYAHHDKVTRSVNEQLRELLSAGYEVIVTTTNPDFSQQCMWSQVEAVVRPNEGWDVGAWARVLTQRSEIRESDFLLMMNDSCLGPIKSMQKVFDHIDDQKADYWGLTDNIAQSQYHYQSYMRGFSRAALQDDVVWEFLTEVESVDKFATVQRYEMGFPIQYVVDQGLKTSVMFEYTKVLSQRFIDALDDPNQYIYGWERLLALGYPFVKKSLFTQFNIMSNNDVEFIKTVYGVDIKEYM